GRPSVGAGLRPGDLDRTRGSQRIVDRHRAGERGSGGGGGCCRNCRIRRQVQGKCRLCGGAATGGDRLRVDRRQAGGGGITDDVALSVGAP
ncbi:hypothetical protein V8941_16375, partial [Acinetobacter soli]